MEKYKHQAIFDEIQRVPDLISYLQTKVDCVNKKGHYILTGSHNFLLMEQISQSLARRVGIARLLPFSVEKLTGCSFDDLHLIYGGGELYRRNEMHVAGWNKIFEGVLGDYDILDKFKIKPRP